MNISAQVQNMYQDHQITLTTNGNQHVITIPSGISGYGSSVNGGELLFLALATCYCNDIYREAAKRDIAITQVNVDVDGEFGAEGEPGRNITYKVRVVADASDAEIEDLVRHTDQVAEIHNTLRISSAVKLTDVEVGQAGN